METAKDAKHLYPVERRAEYGGESSATFLVLQGIGEYDFVPLVPNAKS